jgi:hypothetical protein
MFFGGKDDERFVGVCQTENDLGTVSPVEFGEYLTAA